VRPEAAEHDGAQSNAARRIRGDPLGHALRDGGIAGPVVGKQRHRPTFITK
jgi:hypothetical protein